MISVCMATYNGEKYILEQINSIISQLDENDELIIVDDCSKDNTVKIIESISDKRIKIFINEHNLGVNRSFERAIQMSKGEFIFLSDQDDIWTVDRKNRMMNVFKGEKYSLVSGNSLFVDGNGNVIEHSGCVGLEDADSKKNKKNIINIFLGKAGYYGCAMVLKHDILKYILPFPEYIESHDLWIAMVANVLGRNYHLEEVVLRRRIHGNNASIVERSWIKKIYSRWIFTKSFLEIRKRIKYSKKLN